jgi:hypothetical protein
VGGRMNGFMDLWVLYVKILVFLKVLCGRKYERAIIEMLEKDEVV